MPRGRYQQQQWDQREADILAALDALSAARGFASVTMDDLADAVGISKATLYQHFRSRDDLLAHLMAQHTARFLEWLATTEAQPPLARLSSVLRALIAGHSMPLAGLTSVPREETHRIFHSRPDLVQQHQEVLAAMVAIVEAGQAEGSIRPDLAPGVVIGVLQALSSLPPAGAPGMPSLPPPAEVEHQLVALFERALRPD